MTRTERLRQRELRRSIERRQFQKNAGPEYWLGALNVQARKAGRMQAKAWRPPLPEEVEQAQKAMREARQLAEWAAHFARALGGIEEEPVNRATRRALATIQKGAK